MNCPKCSQKSKQVAMSETDTYYCFDCDYCFGHSGKVLLLYYKDHCPVCWEKMRDFVTCNHCTVEWKI